MKHPKLSNNPALKYVISNYENSSVRRFRIDIVFGAAHSLRAIESMKNYYNHHLSQDDYLRDLKKSWDNGSLGISKITWLILLTRDGRLQIEEPRG